MATQTTGGGSTTSFTNTPQANSDTYNYIEDALYNDSSLYSKTTKTVFLDVMSNDLGGNAKTLFSVDDGGTGALTDLLKLETAWEQTADKNWIRVYGGKIEFKIGDGSNDIANARSVDSLDTDDSVDDTFLYAIRMANGTLAYATVHITITGENDAVELGTVTDAAITDTAANDVFTDITGTLTSTDPDASDTPTYSVAGGVATLESGFDVEVATAYGTLYFNQSTGAYKFVADNAAIQALDGGDAPVTLDFAVSVSDGDLSDGDTLTITITGANDAPELGTVTDAAITDTAANDVFTDITGTLTSTDRDAGDSPTYSVTGGVATLESGFDVEVATAYGTLYLNQSTGAYKFVADNAAIQALDGGDAPIALDFAVSVSDGDASDGDTLTITVTGANDGPVAVADAGSAGENQTKSFDVLANDTDVDTGDTKTLDSLGTVTVTSANGTVHAIDASAAFTIDGGQIKFTPGTLFDALDFDDTATVVVNYTMKDSQGATSSSALTLTVNGANDAPELTGTQATLADGTEDNSYTVSEADLLAGFTDVDGDTLAITNLTSNHGPAVQNIDGSWTITPTDNYNGTVTLSYTVVDGHGGSVPATITFDLDAVNDPAVIGGTAEGEVTEDAVPNTVSGTLTAADVDNPPNTFQATSGSTTYGSFTMAAGGLWTYTLNNSNALVNALVAGAFLMDSFTVYAQDGTAQLIDITINGANDGPSFPSTYNGLDAVNDHDSDLGVGTSSNPLLPGATEGNDTLDGRTTGSGADTINALGGDDTVNAGAGGDNVYGGAGSDHVFGGEGNDTLYGQTGNDFLYGQGGNDSLFGGSGDDTLEGGDNTDMLLNGGSGNDTIIGGLGNDIIIGGFGADTLTGGDGNDDFRYFDVRDTNDTILDFMAGDEIDLSGIDADPSTLLNDAFGWGGTTPTAHGVWYSEGGGNTVLYADTDGNTGTVEFMLTLQTFSAWGTSYDQAAEGPPPGVTL